jgi:uncharacterized membrane protein YqhA
MLVQGGLRIAIYRSALKAFVAVGDMSNEQLAWKVGIHVTFVFSGVMFAIMDWLGGPKKHGAGG